MCDIHLKFPKLKQP